MRQKLVIGLVLGLVLASIGVTALERYSFKGDKMPMIYNGNPGTYDARGHIVVRGDDQIQSRGTLIEKWKDKNNESYWISTRWGAKTAEVIVNNDHGIVIWVDAWSTINTNGNSMKFAFSQANRYKTRIPIVYNKAIDHLYINNHYMNGIKFI